MSVDFRTAGNYKKCRRKQYEAYICMPPEDTVVINSLEHPEIVKQLRGRTYFTSSDVMNAKLNNPVLFNKIMALIINGQAYVVTKYDPVVICGKLGELRTIDLNTLSRVYTFVSNGQPVPINPQTLTKKMHNKVLDWTLVKSNPSRLEEFACFIPKGQQDYVLSSKGISQGININGISHGKGDFVVVPSMNGQPFLNDMIVVNGRLFSIMYDNRGWEDKVTISYNLTRNVNLPELVYYDADSPTIEKLFKVLKESCDYLRMQDLYTYFSGNKALKRTDVEYLVYIMNIMTNLYLSAHDRFRDGFIWRDTLENIKQGKPLYRLGLYSSKHPDYVCYLGIKGGDSGAKKLMYEFMGIGSNGRFHYNIRRRAQLVVMKDIITILRSAGF